MKLNPGNIWSGNPDLARYTNPTELAKKKGNLDKSYPVVYNGVVYDDAESAWKATKDMRGVLIAKLTQYPELFDDLETSGGEDFIMLCDHLVYGRGFWEGKSTESPFIRELLSAYRHVKNFKVFING